MHSPWPNSRQETGGSTTDTQNKIRYKLDNNKAKMTYRCDPNDPNNTNDPNDPNDPKTLK